MNLKLINFILFLLLIFPKAGNSEANPVIHACFTNWPPYSYLQEGKPVGFSLELYREALERTGLDVQFHHKPWARCRHEFARGQMQALVDGGPKVPNSINVERPPIPWAIAFWVHQDEEADQFVGYSQFNDAKVGYVRGYGYPKAFLTYRGFKKFVVNDDLEGLTMLNAKRFSAFLGDAVSNLDLVKEHELQVKLLTPAVEMRYLTLSFHTSLQAQHTKFERALNEMYADGTINQLYKKYLGMGYQEFLNKFSDLRPED